MSKIYARRVRAGIMTLEQIPDRWREEVEALLDE